MRSAMLAAGALGLAAAAFPAVAQDAAAGRKVAAQTCQGCHGVDGVAVVPDTPGLAAQDAGYLLRQLQAFKSGDRHNELMQTVVQGLSDQQLQDAAAYYAGI